MSKLDKILIKLLSGNSDSNFSFNDIKSLLIGLGFFERTTGGSHKIFFKDDIVEIINIQPDGAKAKAYQVKQIRTLILKYKLAKNGS